VQLFKEYGIERQQKESDEKEDAQRVEWRIGNGREGEQFKEGVGEAFFIFLQMKFSLTFALGQVVFSVRDAG
jgi:hypothetical protein